MVRKTAMTGDDCRRWVADLVASSIGIPGVRAVEVRLEPADPAFSVAYHLASGRQFVVPIKLADMREHAPDAVASLVKSAMQLQDAQPDLFAAMLRRLNDEG